MKSLFGIVALALALSMSARAKEDNWTKMRQCAAQAEKWEADNRGFFDSYKHHYSPRYDRCYVLTEKFLYGGRWIMTGLYDAFEDNKLASTETYPGHAIGAIGENYATEAGYEPAREFIADHMTN